MDAQRALYAYDKHDVMSQSLFVDVARWESRIRRGVFEYWIRKGQHSRLHVCLGDYMSQGTSVRMRQNIPGTDQKWQHIPKREEGTCGKRYVKIVNVHAAGHLYIELQGQNLCIVLTLQNLRFQKLKTRTMVRHARIQPPTLKITIARYQTFVSADHFKALHLQNMRFRGLDRHNMQIVGTRTITCHGPFVFLLASQNGKIDFEKSAVQRVQPKCLCSKTAFK
jgi:hypothetical protein